MESKGQKPTYSIDDILAEAQKMKEHRQVAKSSPPPLSTPDVPAPLTSDSAEPASRDERKLISPAASPAAVVKQEVNVQTQQPVPQVPPEPDDFLFYFTGEQPIPDLSALNGEKEPDGGMSDKERDAERGRKRERKKKKKRFSMGRSAEYMGDSDSDLLFSEPHMPFSFKEPSSGMNSVEKSPKKPKVEPIPPAPVTPPPVKPIPPAPASPVPPTPMKMAEPVEMASSSAEETGVTTVFLPEEEDVRIYAPSHKTEQEPAVMPKEELPKPDKRQDDTAATRLVELPSTVKTVTKPTAKPLPKPVETDEMDGQLKIDDYVDDREEGESEADWEERLRKSRQEKIKTFRLLHNDEVGGFKLSGDEEENNDPLEEPDTFEDGELEDYNSYEETDAVQNELTYRRRTGWISLLLTGVAEVVLCWLTLMTYMAVVPPVEPNLFIAIHAFLLGIMLLVNHQMVGSGIANLFRMRADADSAVSVAAVFTWIHTLLQFFNTAAVSEGRSMLFTAAAGLGLLLGAVGRQMRIGRICENFRFVSHPAEKYAARRIEDPQTAVDIGRSAVALGDPEVAYFKKTNFLKKFLENSYGDDGSDRVMRIFMPLSVVCSLVLAAAAYFFVKIGIWDAVAVGVGTLCLSAPVAALMASNFPLLRMSKKVLRRGAMLTGWNAVEEFGDLHAMVVDAEELFPSESVLLHGIKTFSGARIDEALLDAAAVSISAGGPLAGVFRRVIENKTEILPAVDSLVYEQDMGLSGWVGGRRVLVGNRRLLENHGVDVPSRDYENRYTKGDRQLVYLSTTGELSAMFVVSYVADEGIRQALREFQKVGLTMLVRTCDPNVTEKLVCDVFELDDYYVEVMGVTAGRAYEKLLSTPDRDNPEAMLASNGRLEGMAAALTGCRRLRTGVGLAVAAQVIGGIGGLALNAFLALTSGLSFPPLYMLAYLLGWSVLSWLLPVFRKI